MSVWKKAAKTNQKTHRERHNPEARQHLGLLEKKKDHIKRAQDYNEKRDTIKLLRRRALNRNPEEFYHHMINSKVSDGVHHEKDTSDDHTHDQIRLMETQDVRYVNMKRTQEMKRVERLQSQLHLIDVDKKVNNTHKFFFDSKRDAERFQTERKTHNGNDTAVNYSLAALSEKPLANLDPKILEQVSRKRENMYKELVARIKREKELTVVQQKLEIKKYLQTKKNSLPPKKVSAASKDCPPIYKWKSQRKR